MATTSADETQSQTQFYNVLTWAREKNLTIRQIFEHSADARCQLIQPAYLPAGLGDFVEMAIPELQTRGIFRTEYQVSVLRANRGLPMPRVRMDS
jgi:hypothetical protein